MIKLFCISHFGFLLTVDAMKQTKVANVDKIEEEKEGEEGQGEKTEGEEKEVAGTLIIKVLIL